jgi:hypothetical protein
MHITTFGFYKIAFGFGFVFVCLLGLLLPLSWFILSLL